MFNTVLRAALRRSTSAASVSAYMASSDAECYDSSTSSAHAAIRLNLSLYLWHSLRNATNSSDSPTGRNVLSLALSARTCSVKSLFFSRNAACAIFIACKPRSFLSTASLRSLISSCNAPILLVKLAILRSAANASGNAAFLSCREVASVSRSFDTSATLAFNCLTSYFNNSMTVSRCSNLNGSISSVYFGALGGSGAQCLHM